MDQRFTPGREQDGKVPSTLAPGPADKPLQRLFVRRQFCSGFPALAEWAIPATVVTARQRAPVEDRQVYCHAYSSIRCRTAGE